MIIGTNAVQWYQYNLSWWRLQNLKITVFFITFLVLTALCHCVIFDEKWVAESTFKKEHKFMKYPYKTTPNWILFCSNPAFSSGRPYNWFCTISIKIAPENDNSMPSGALFSQSIGLKSYSEHFPTCLEWYQVYLASLGYFRWP